MLALDALTMVASGGGVVWLSIGLAQAVDALAEWTGLGRIWLGAVLLATATSLPELATDVSAVLLGAPDLAVGDLFGSSLTNLLLLGVLDVSRPRDGLLRRSTRAHRSTLRLAIGLTVVAGVLVALQPPFTLGWLSPGSLLLVVLYALGVRRLSGTTIAAASSRETPRRAIQGPARRAAARFILAAAGLLVVAPLFATAARNFAERSGLGTTFIGAWVVALATSLPEIVTCLTALRLGAPDLAVGNLFGSNAFNMIIFAPLDALQRESFFVGLDRAHLIVAGGTIVMSAAVAWLLRRGGGRRRWFPPGVVLIGLYVICLAVLRFVTAGASP